MKSKPKASRKLDKALMRDFALLLPITCLLLVSILDMPWRDAALVSPVVLLAVFGSLYVAVLFLHSLFNFSDRVAHRFSVRRSPLL